MSTKPPASRPRTVREIREAMADNRARLEDDLLELEDRLENSFSPKRLLTRHPVVTSIAGAVVGFVVFRHPALVTKSLTRLAQLGAPFIIKALLQRGDGDGDGDGDGHEGRDDEPSGNEGTGDDAERS